MWIKTNDRLINLKHVVEIFIRPTKKSDATHDLVYESIDHDYNIILSGTLIECETKYNLINYGLNTKFTYLDLTKG